MFTGGFLRARLLLEGLFNEREKGLLALQLLVVAGSAPHKPSPTRRYSSLLKSEFGQAARRCGCRCVGLDIDGPPLGMRLAFGILRNQDVPVFTVVWAWAEPAKRSHKCGALAWPLRL